MNQLTISNLADAPGTTFTERPEDVGPASDLARRITDRRTELGLSVEEVAKRSGVDPGYLRYFEHSPEAKLSAGTLLLMANALQTTPIALMGGEMDRPAGHGRAGAHPMLDTLSQEQCETHLAAGGVGRLVYTTDRGPIAIPVNFEFTAGEVIISTDPAKASLLESLDWVSFEIDRVDDTLGEGWSVVASGGARLVGDKDEHLRLASLDLESWVGGNRHTLVAIRPQVLTGRVIVHEIDSDEG